MYARASAEQQAQQAQQSGTGSAGSSKGKSGDDDVVDADFEEVHK
jgi:hypothetical protein